MYRERCGPDDCNADHDDRNTTTSGSKLRYLDIQTAAKGFGGQMRVVVDSDQGHKTKGLMSWVQATLGVCQRCANVFFGRQSAAPVPS
jgi:hypothetical protein